MEVLKHAKNASCTVLQVKVESSLCQRWNPAGVKQENFLVFNLSPLDLSLVKQTNKTMPVCFLSFFWALIVLNALFVSAYH